MKKQKGPRAFDDVWDLIEKAIKAQKGFVCIGDAEERRATAFYCAKLRATKRILFACGKVMIVKDSSDRPYFAFFRRGNERLADAILEYRKVLASWGRAERRRAAFEMGEDSIARGLGHIPSLNAGRKSMKASRSEARKLGLRIKP